MRFHVHPMCNAAFSRGDDKEKRDAFDDLLTGARGPIFIGDSPTITALR